MLAAALTAAVALAGGCGPRTGPRAPGGPAPLTLDDLVVHGDAVVARTSMDVLLESPLTSVLLEGLETQMTERVEELGFALEVTDRAPLEQADGVLVTGRPLDERSGLVAVGLSYRQDVDWFDDFVRAVNGDAPEEGVLADLDGGGRLGVLARDTRESWHTEMPAAVCAVKLSDRIVAFVTAPDAGECVVWASWVLGRREGDPDLLAKLSDAPRTAGAEPPLAAYVDGGKLEKLGDVPLDLGEKVSGMTEAWLGLDPGAPAHVAVSVAFQDAQTAQLRRDALAMLLDSYAPFVTKLSPGLASAYESLDLAVEGPVLTASVTIEAEYVHQLADMLSPMM
jgi:hypothetical protein